MPLSDMAVRHAKPDGKDRHLADFDGLYLFIPAKGHKAWHFRYYYAGKRTWLSLGTYPEVPLREARALRDEARALLAKGLNPAVERERQQQAQVLAHDNTFEAVYEQWRDHRKLSLDEGRQSTLTQIKRTFNNDVFPVTRGLSIYEVTQAHLLECIRRIEKRGSCSVAEKLRTWFEQLFRYAKVAVPGLKENPALDLDAVAIPLPPVNHNPFLRMSELPAFLQILRKYGGKLNTQLGVRLLMLTGVRTCELRFATPDQFDLDRGLWMIPVTRLKQRRQLKRNKRQRLSDIPPYTVPLPLQAQEIVRHLLADFKPAQVYMLPGEKSLKQPISENTLNQAIKRMGYDGLLTGHGLRSTLSTALNEIGYPPKWVDAQLSHADPNKTSATYNHAEYVEQRRIMMQDWADRLDLLEQEHVEAACTHLTITLQGLPTIPGRATENPPVVNPAAPILKVAPAGESTPSVSPTAHRLPAVQVPMKELPKHSDVQRERNLQLEEFEAPHNLRVVEYAKLAGKSRRWISYEIQARNVLALSMGHRGMRVPDWQLEPIKGRVVQSVLRRLSPGIDNWQIYRVLIQPHERLGGKPPIEAVMANNLERVIKLVCEEVEAAVWSSTAFSREGDDSVEERAGACKEGLLPWSAVVSDTDSSASRVIVRH